MDFKIIKVTPFTVGEGDNKKEGKSYSVNYKGRNIQVSTLDFENNELVESEDKKTLTVKGEIECMQSKYTDQVTGEQRTGLRMKPKMDLLVVSY